MSQDPTVMYLIVKTSLAMSMEKTAAQVGHAVGLLVEEHYERAKYIKACDTLQLKHNKDTERLEIFDQWMHSDYRKVVLAADDKEFEKIKSEIPESDRVVVIDNGLTELNPHTETVIGLWPMYKSQVPKVIKRLQLLK